MRGPTRLLVIAAFAVSVVPHTAQTNRTTRANMPRATTSPPGLLSAPVGTIAGRIADAADLLTLLTSGARLVDTLRAVSSRFDVRIDAIGFASAVLTTRPVPGQLSSQFGDRRHPITHRRRRHKGVDFYARRGQRVVAAADGVVTHAGRYGAYGRVVFIDHGFGVETRYAHLSRIAVRDGDPVAAGQAIGRAGSTGRATGPHLHFEVRVDGQPFAPTDVMSLE